MHRIKVCMCIVHKDPGGGRVFPVPYVMSPSLDYVNLFAVTARDVISMATLLSLIFTSDFNQAVVHYTCIYSQISAWSLSGLSQNWDRHEAYNLHDITTVLQWRA